MFITIYLIGTILCYIAINVSCALNYLNKYQNEYENMTFEEKLIIKDRASAMVYGQMNNWLPNTILALCWPFTLCHLITFGIVSLIDKYTKEQNSKKD